MLLFESQTLILEKWSDTFLLVFANKNKPRGKSDCF